MLENLLTKEKKVISDAVKERLLDPDSAKFKWLPLAGAMPDHYCGVVNSKNTFGGYAGDALFAVFLFWIRNSVSAAFLRDVGNADWSSSDSKFVLDTCAKDGYTNLFLTK